MARFPAQEGSLMQLRDALYPKTITRFTQIEVLPVDKKCIFYLGLQLKHIILCNNAFI